MVEKQKLSESDTIIIGDKTSIELYAERLKRMYPIYYRLDEESKNIVSEIAKKYPYSTEHVACTFLMCGNNQEETEKYIMREIYSI